MSILGSLRPLPTTMERMKFKKKTYYLRNRKDSKNVPGYEEPGMQRRPYAEGEFSWADVPKNVPGYEGTPARGRKAGMSNDEIRL